MPAAPSKHAQRLDPHRCARILQKLRERTIPGKGYRDVVPVGSQQPDILL
jgi:hypothetical protein